MQGLSTLVACRGPATPGPLQAAAIRAIHARRLDAAPSPEVASDSFYATGTDRISMATPKKGR